MTLLACGSFSRSSSKKVFEKGHLVFLRALRRAESRSLEWSLSHFSCDRKEHSKLASQAHGSAPPPIRRSFVSTPSASPMDDAGAGMSKASRRDPWHRPRPSPESAFRRVS
jgi:hypothetical protein